jgi:hypothetical protein
MEQPDAKLHQRISFVKSGLRVIAGYTLICGDLVLGGSFLIAAELLGIVEELV